MSDNQAQSKKERSFVDWALRPRKKPFITPDHPLADVFSRVLGAGLLTTSGSEKKSKSNFPKQEI